MTLTEQVFAQAALLAGELDGRQTNLLRLLCGASASSLTARLREGLTPEDCKADFIAAASLLAVIPLTILTRVFAILQKTPVTVFLLSGIFPLVPGAGIYYTAYYFIQGDNALALSNGISTFKVAVALAVGISLVLSIPLPPRHRSG